MGWETPGSPISQIQVMTSVPLYPDYEHTIYFESPEDQETYFQSKVQSTFDRFTYLRKDHLIKIAGYYENAEGWNYLRFRNNPTGKWYYHFITKVEYIGENAVALHLELDVLQTYRFDWELLPSHIDRWHVPDDEPGRYTVDEGLDCGELEEFATYDYMFDDLCIMVQHTVKDLFKANPTGIYDNMFMGLRTSMVKKENAISLRQWLDTLDSAGKADAVITMWMYPRQLVKDDPSWMTLEKGYIVPVDGANLVDKVAVPDKLGNKVGSYNPKNKKLLCYPYTMLAVSNNMGGSAVFHRERLTKVYNNNHYQFKIIGGLSPDAGVQLIPYAYNNGSNYNAGYEYALSINNFPTCAWSSDAYKVWLAQNQHSQATAIQQARVQGGLQVLGGMATVGASAAMGNLVGVGAGLMTAFHGATSTYNNVQSVMAQRKDMAVQPDQAKGNHSTSVNVTHGRCGFTFRYMAITDEYARRIDDFFTRYGYKVNIIDLPCLKNRERFTYIKTNGLCIRDNGHGCLGSEAIMRIQAIFDKGVTWWVDPDEVGWYFGDNNELEVS